MPRRRLRACQRRAAGVVRSNTDSLTTMFTLVLPSLSTLAAVSPSPSGTATLHPRPRGTETHEANPNPAGHTQAPPRTERPRRRPRRCSDRHGATRPGGDVEARERRLRAPAARRAARAAGAAGAAARALRARSSGRQGGRRGGGPRGRALSRRHFVRRARGLPAPHAALGRVRVQPPIVAEVPREPSASPRARKARLHRREAGEVYRLRDGARRISGRSGCSRRIPRHLACAAQAESSGSGTRTCACLSTATSSDNLRT
jgi:hypothetical protein